MAHKNKAAKVLDQSEQYPHKRTKLDTLSAPANAIPRFAPAPLSPPQPPPTPPPRQKSPITTIRDPPSLPDILPPSLNHLQLKYSLATLSVISSSKIVKKVQTILFHLSAINLADLTSKPGVVVLHAKATVAAKMVSVVEIAKREIEKDGAKWWQYTRLEGKVEELKDRENKKRPMGESKGRTLKDWEATKRVGNETKEGSKVTENDDVVMPDPATSDAQEEEDAFETMPSNSRRNDFNRDKVDATARPKLRAIPTLTIYLSRMPVPEFKALYGEQTNA